MSTRRGRTYTWTAVSVLAVWLLVILNGSAWHGSAELHTVIETVATLFALMIGVVALLRFQTARSNTVLFIGIGFFGTGFLDGYHAMVTSQWFVQLLPSSPPSLLFWSWNASRVFLSVLMFLSWWAWLRETRLGLAGQVSEKTVLVVVGVLCVASFCFFAFVPLPRTHYTEYVLRRPEEFVAGAFFLCALVGYLRKGAWANDAFEHWVVLSLVVGVISQAMFMSLSFKLFDAMFDMAHLLKVASYFCVLTGLLVNTYELFTRAERGAIELAGVNRSLREEIAHREEAEEQIRQLNSTLERRVEERGAELTATMESLRATERQSRRQLAKLTRANRDLDDFAYAASHDLRAPLRAIDNLANWISEDAGEVLPEKAREHFCKMRQRVRRMEQLLDDLLEYSRVGYGQGDEEEVDTARLVQATVEFLDPPEGFTVSTGPELPTLMTYKVPLQQVFRNLIDNAIKHHDSADGHVHVSSANRGDLVEFTVADDGPGIPAEYHDRIFDKFQTLRPRSEREATGMGLSIVKRLVEDQGGSIRVECGKEGGAAFRFYWPKERIGAPVRT